MREPHYCLWLTGILVFAAVILHTKGLHDAGLLWVPAIYLGLRGLGASR
jgi:hypothetical protein